MANTILEQNNNTNLTAVTNTINYNNDIISNSELELVNKDTLIENSAILNKHIIPQPLNSAKLLNYKYKRFATGDLNGISNTEAFANINTIAAMNNVDDNMYIPSLGELGLIIQNIGYINNVINKYNGNQISLNDKYVSSTLYTDTNISNDNYQLNKQPINNVWFIDTSYAKISYASILDNYQIIPLYKYSPFIETMDIENEDEHDIKDISTCIDPWEYLNQNNLRDFINKTGNFSENGYICGKYESSFTCVENNITLTGSEANYYLMKYYFYSFIFNYKNPQILLGNIVENISGNEIRFVDILYNGFLNVWQLPHKGSNITFCRKNIHTGSYEYNELSFAIILPSFMYGGLFYYTDRQLDNLNQNNNYYHLNNITIDAYFFNDENYYISFKPITNDKLFDCMVFKPNKSILIEDYMLNDVSIENTVKFIVKYKNNVIFETEYYFDIYQFIMTGNIFNNIDNYATFQFTKTNILYSDINSQYIDNKNLPIINSEPNSVYISKYYSNNEQNGIRVGKYNKDNIKELSYIAESNNYAYYGISYIDNYFTCGEGGSLLIDQLYNYDNNNDNYNGNANMSLSFKMQFNNSLMLRTFINKDKFGIYNDCIINNLIGPNNDNEDEINNANKTGINHDIKFKFINYGTYGYQYDIQNLPILGSKQLLEFLPIAYDNPDFQYIMFTDYLYIYNNTEFKISITLEDELKILTQTKSIITIESKQMLLYYPVSCERDYNINIEEYNSNITFTLYELSYGPNPITMLNTNLPKIYNFYKNPSTISYNDALINYLNNNAHYNIKKINNKISIRINNILTPMRGHVLVIDEESIETIIQPWIFEEE